MRPVEAQLPIWHKCSWIVYWKMTDSTQVHWSYVRIGSVYLRNLKPFLLYGLLPWNLRKPAIPLEDPQSERWQQQPKSCLGFVPILRSFWFIYPSCEANLPTAPPRCLRPLHLSHLCHWEDDMQWMNRNVVARALESHHNYRRCS